MHSTQNITIDPILVFISGQKKTATTTKKTSLEIESLFRIELTDLAEFRRPNTINQSFICYVRNNFIRELALSSERTTIWVQSKTQQ